MSSATPNIHLILCHKSYRAYNFYTFIDLFDLSTQAHIVMDVEILPASKYLIVLKRPLCKKYRTLFLESVASFLSGF
jgi:hypothetical protein